MDQHGQSSSEYVAILLVVGTLMAGAATLAVAMPGVGDRLVRTIRTGICIVGGDVCRAADAKAAGLEPCLTRERAERQETTLDIAVVRVGENGEWQLALRSDGQAVVTRLEDSELGATAGVGITFSPASVSADASAALVAGYHDGRAWRFADARAAAAFVNAAMHDASVLLGRTPDVRWHALGSHASGEAGAAIADLARVGITVAAESAIGLRDDGVLRTVALDVGVEDPDVSIDLPGFPGGHGTGRALVAELSWDRGDLREFALRTAVGDGDRLDEYSARLDLRDPANRAAAERLLRIGEPKPAALRALAARVRSDGVVERNGYTVSERRRGFNIAGKLGVALGLEHERISSERRLVDAVASVRGGAPQRRFDCLGV
jgi:hypothetical protein